ncbi:hypothetical protein KSP39_PZI020100 [Platanthera zijinensis]|uniref:Uncharacterized protein n=1 Tax=Platanthera zijinensis TaxID=2320716 RepID=A0AAP0AZF3_9ASPA
MRAVLGSTQWSRPTPPPPLPLTSLSKKRLRVLRIPSKRLLLRLLSVIAFFAFVPPVFFHFRLRRLQLMRMRMCNWLESPPLVCAHGGDSSRAAANTIHSKKRNRLAQQRLNDLVFVKYNRALRRRYDARDRIDPISLTDIDDNDEWLMGRMEEDNDAEAEREDLVFDDELLTWGIVATATGVEKEMYRTRLSKGKNVVPTKILEKRSILKMKTPTPLAIREATTPLVIREANTPLVLRNTDDIDEEEVEYNKEEEYNDSGEDDEDIVFSEDE